MESIRKQFSLDWLPGSQGSATRESSQLTRSSLEEAREFMYSSVVGNILRIDSDHQMPLHDLARAMKDDIKEFKFEELWEVIKVLAVRGIIEVTDTNESSGNYTIKLLG
jgi:hypothetical protein